MDWFRNFVILLLAVWPAAAQNPAAQEARESAAGAALQAKPQMAQPSTAGSPAALQSEASESASPAALTANPDFRTAFKVKYVAQGAAYLDGGRSAGLSEGMKLTIRESTASAASPNPDPAKAGVVAELEVLSVAETSAVTSITAPSREVRRGDMAYLSGEDQQSLVQKSALSSTRKYPAVISFSEGDTLDDEVREVIPRPPLPSVNRARGRIGFDYMGTVSRGSSSSSATGNNLGLVMRLDITRINGTFWNANGYWRGRLNSRSSSGQQTLQDLINRTYTLGVTYDNPNSAWVAGFGRMYLPWATSLEVLDGGYFGRRLRAGTTGGIFFGSTPDPASWTYDPNRRIAGTFVNFEGGSFDSVHYSSTSGFGVEMTGWQVNKPFVFFENSLAFTRKLSLYQSLQADSPSGNAAVAAPGAGIGRSFLTLRVQPVERVEIDFNHTYLRDVPTFDPQLIGTGLLDKYLFQGFSVGGRVEVRKQVWLYTTLGSSNRSGDTQRSLNQSYGVTFGRIPWAGVRADLHYSIFNSAFGSGSYRALSLGKNVGDNLHLDLLAGEQRYSSSFAANSRSRFLNLNAETNLGRHYFVQGGFTVNRGQSLSYDQWSIILGYRFDSKQRRE